MNKESIIAAAIEKSEQFLIENPLKLTKGTKKQKEFAQAIYKQRVLTFFAEAVMQCIIRNTPEKIEKYENKYKEVISTKDAAAIINKWKDGFYSVETRNYASNVEFLKNSLAW